MNRFLGAFLASTLVFIAGCGINTVRKEKIVLTGIYGDDKAKIEENLKQLRPGMTKEEVVRVGFNLQAKNVQCVRGAAAMPYIVGDVKNTVDLSDETKIDAYAKTVSAYEACLVPHQKIVTEKSKWYFADDGGKTKGSDELYLIAFKNNKLYDAYPLSKKVRDEIDRESSWGGNVIDGVIGGAISATKRFR